MTNYKLAFGILFSIVSTIIGVGLLVQATTINETSISTDNLYLTNDNLARTKVCTGNEFLKATFNNSTGGICAEPGTPDLSDYFTKARYYDNATASFADWETVNSLPTIGDLAEYQTIEQANIDYVTINNSIATKTTWSQVDNGTFLKSVPGTYATGGQVTANRTEAYTNGTLTWQPLGDYTTGGQVTANLTNYPLTSSVDAWIQGNKTTLTTLATGLSQVGNSSYTTIFSISLIASKFNYIESKIFMNSSATANGIRLRATVNDNANVGSCTFSSPSGATANTFDTLSITTSTANTGETASALANLPMAFVVDCAIKATSGSNTLTLAVTNELSTGTTGVYPGSWYSNTTI